MKSKIVLLGRILLMILLITVSGIEIYAQNILLEAEDGTLFGGNPRIESSAGGYSGNGYVNGFESINEGVDGVTVTFNLDNSTEYSLFVGYSSPNGYKENFVDINGVRVDTTVFEQYDGFAEILLGDFTFLKGENKITFSNYWGWCMLDYFKISDISPRGDFVITPESAATGDILTFDATATNDPNGTIVSYDWDFGDGSAASGMIGKHVYKTEGEKTITLTLTDNDANVTTITKSISVARTEPYAVFKYSEEFPAPGIEITFDGTLSYDLTGDVVSWVWDFGDGNTSTDSIAKHTFGSQGNFKVSLTVTNNRGKSNTREMVLFVYDGAVILRGPDLLTTTPETNDKIELAFQVKADYTNPYDPEQVKVDAVITHPNGTDSIVVPCFYHEGVYYQQEQWHLDSTNFGWRLRFLANQTGDYKVKLKYTGSGSEQAPDFTVTVTQGQSKGIIHNVESNNQYYKHETGEVYCPWGINIGWNSIAKYSEILTNISQYHGNFFRYWLTPFANQALEWSSDNSFYDGLGKFSQIAAGMTDSLLNLSKELDVYMQLVLFQHGPFSETVNAIWDENPYNKVNGGFVDKAEEFFYNEDCKLYTKKLIRYIVARWGYSPNIFAWEFFNEVQFTGNFPNQSALWFPGVVQWHSEMGNYVASLDAFDHITTTSAGHDQLKGLDSISNLDVLQYHLYSTELLDQQKTLDSNFKETLNHAIINGEYGEDVITADVPLQKQQISLWNSIMTEVPHIMWLWDNYHRTEWGKVFYYPAEYLKDEDFTQFKEWENFDFQATSDVSVLETTGIRGDSNFYGVVYNQNNTELRQKVTLGGMKLPYGYYNIEYYIASANQIIRIDSFLLIREINTLELPEFSASLAFKLKYTADYNDPIALAGPDKIAPMGEAVSLDGSKSFDPKGGSITYSWTLYKKPVESTLNISGENTALLEFDPDKAGYYYFSLSVSNGTISSIPDTVVVIASTKPVAIANGDGSVLPRKYFELDGSQSYDPDSEEITYLWSLLSKPSGALDPIILNYTEKNAMFRGTDLGEYLVSLVVNDGIQDSDPDIVKITVSETSTISELSSNFVQVYPNPAKSELFVELVDNSVGLSAIEVYTIYGQLVMQQKVDPKSSSEGSIVPLDISSLNKGLYIVSVTSGDLRSVHQLVVE